MTWESRRNGKSYYYRKRRQGGKVISEYVGAGAIADLFSAIADRDRHDRTMLRHELERIFHTQRSVDERLDAFRRQVRAAVDDALQQAGFHRHHRGEWRRRRGISMANEVELATMPKGIGILAQSVLGEVLRCAGITSDSTKKAILAEVAGLRARLGWHDAPPHERLLIECIAVSWLRLQFVEQLLSTNATEGNYKMAVAEHFERRLSLSHRRYVEATLALARVRRLGINVQINVAQNQVVQNGGA